MVNDLGCDTFTILPYGAFFVIKEFYDGVDENDIIEIDEKTGSIKNSTKNRIYSSTQFPKHIIRIFESNGLIQYLNNQG